MRVAAVLPDGRFVSVSTDAAVRLCTPDGTLERTFSDGFVGVVYSVAATADGEHIVVGIGCGSKGEVRLYHIDGTLVHSFKGIPEYYKGTPARSSAWRRRATASTSSAARPTSSSRCGASPASTS